MFQVQRGPHESQYQRFNAEAMQLDPLTIVSIPHHSRILEKLATVKASMPGGRKPEGVFHHFGHAMRQTHVYRC
jgi:hypothetical protein